jgi:PTS system cellobiose-specific IIA component
MENEVMQIIVYAGNAKSIAMQSIQAAKQGDDERAQQKLTEAEKNLTEAHHAHAKILSETAAAKETAVNLFIVHGEDHMMAAITTIDLAKEFVKVHKRVSALENELAQLKILMNK